jgi:hypothetical protein
MKFEEITVKGSGFIHCQSNFYSSQDILQYETEYRFFKGINILHGEIDSGIWGISYLLSMYTYRKKDCMLLETPDIHANGKKFLMKDIQNASCYMDSCYPLFSHNKTIEKLIAKSIRRNNIMYSTEEIRNIFCIDKNRFGRPLDGVGNERFKAMAAIGFCNRKEIFCFPWLSKTRFEYYHLSMLDTMQILKELEKVIIVPIGN